MPECHHKSLILQEKFIIEKKNRGMNNFVVNCTWVRILNDVQLAIFIP